MLPPVQPDRPESGLGSGHHVSLGPGRLDLPGGGDGSLFPPGGGLVD
jgi:hypothetical protein